MSMREPGRYERAFWEFHRENPIVYQKLLEFARQARQAGLVRFGIRPLWERLRWWVLFETTDTESTFKLNDHYPAFYARLLMREPDLAGFFETRRSMADDMEDPTTT